MPHEPSKCKTTLGNPEPFHRVLVEGVSVQGEPYTQR